MEKIPKRFWDDEEWVSTHGSELQKKYLNKWVAVVDKKVVAAADDPGIAEKIAREKTGNKYILVEFMESGEALY